MLFRSAIFLAAAALFANVAIGAPVEGENALVARTALSAWDACNCPDNCSHKEGSSCAYIIGPSSKSSVVKGKCQGATGSLTCIPT